MEVLRIVIAVLVELILLSVPGYLFHRWAVKNGVIRTPILFVFITVFASIVIKRSWFADISEWLFAMLVVIASTIGVNRADLWSTYQHGRWWWKSNSSEHEIT
jgi:hypothetical protein